MNFLPTKEGADLINDFFAAGGITNYLCIVKSGFLKSICASTYFKIMFISLIKGILLDGCTLA